MCRCVLCASEIAYTGLFALCDACREQIDTLSPHDPRYIWFSSALRRRLTCMAQPQTRCAR